MSQVAATLRRAMTGQEPIAYIAGLQACNFIKKRLQHRCSPVNSVTFFSTSLFKIHLMVAASAEPDQISLISSAVT